MRPTGHAVILLMVARQTLADARRAWRLAKDMEGLTAALGACVVAARAARRAADEWKHDESIAQKLLDDAERIDAVADDLVASGVFRDSVA